MGVASRGGTLTVVGIQAEHVLETLFLLVDIPLGPQVTVEEDGAGIGSGDGEV